MSVITFKLASKIKLIGHRRRPHGSLFCFPVPQAAEPSAGHRSTATLSEPLLERKAEDVDNNVLHGFIKRNGTTRNSELPRDAFQRDFITGVVVFLHNLLEMRAIFQIMIQNDK